MSRAVAVELGSGSTSVTAAPQQARNLSRVILQACSNASGRGSRIALGRELCSLARNGRALNSSATGVGALGLVQIVVP
jgi:hypothetical protein